MTKKIASLVLALLCLAFCCSCKNTDKVFVAGTPENIAWAMTLYEKTLEVMPQKSFIATADGTGKVVTAGIPTTLKIAGKTMHTPNEVYFENISNGDEVLGINTSFAKRVYFLSTPTQSIYRFASTQGKKPTDANGNILIDQSQWGTASDLSQSQYEEKFGKPIHRLSNYVISKETILAKSAGVTTHDNEKFVFQFVLDVSKGVQSPAVAGYVKQILTMSEKEVAQFEYVAVTFTISRDFRLLHCSVEETYSVKAGFISPKVTNALSYAFEYFESLQVKSF